MVLRGFRLSNRCFTLACWPRLVNMRMRKTYMCISHVSFDQKYVIKKECKRRRLARDRSRRQASRARRPGRCRGRRRGAPAGRAARRSWGGGGDVGRVGRKESQESGRPNRSLYTYTSVFLLFVLPSLPTYIRVFFWICT